jgi:hypothetical protein
MLSTKPLQTSFKPVGGKTHGWCVLLQRFWATDDFEISKMKTYPIEKKQDTIALVQEGATIADVANVTGVHERTIWKWLATAAETGLQSAARPGPKSFFPELAERHIFEWVVCRQLVGHPVGWSVVIRKA